MYCVSIITKNPKNPKNTLAPQGCLHKPSGSSSTNTTALVKLPLHYPLEHTSWGDSAPAPVTFNAAQMTRVLQTRSLAPAVAVPHLKILYTPELGLRGAAADWPQQGQEREALPHSLLLLCAALVVSSRHHDAPAKSAVCRVSRARRDGG